MPIKLPKGFARRKSSGNALDDFQTNNTNTNRDSGSSFRVLARPNSTARPLDGGTAPRPMEDSIPQKSSFELDNEDLFSVVRNDAPNRGSGGTNNSLSTAPYDSAASSSRLSSSSTNPSSVETGSGRNVKPAAQRTPIDVPAPPSSRGGFLKNAGRTFSFGITRNHSREANDLPPVPAIPADQNRRNTVTLTRERAMTTASITTATPPRLDDSNFSIKSSEDDFGNMFAGIHSPPSRENLTSTTPAPVRSSVRAAPPQPIHVNRAAEVESSPYSWNSQTSRDGLINSPSPSRTVTQTSPQPSSLRNITTNAVRPDASLDDNMFDDAPRHRSPEPASPRPQFSPRPPPSSFPASMTRNRTPSNATSIRAPQTDPSEFEVPPLDPALLANAQLATKYEQKLMTSPVLGQSNKIMTPAEFERYKQQKEDTRRYNKVFGRADSDDGSGDEYEDDEDDDRDREAHAVRQRKKQEAHLAVYRQQMMKVTGDAAPTDARIDSTMGGYRAGHSSQFDLSTADRRMSSLTLGGPNLGSGKLAAGEEDDEDEDVPLGILAAHGFPNKNRPPTRLASSSSNPNLRAVAQNAGGASTAGGDAVRAALPAFARHLPPDPYYGAGIVQPAERASLQMHASPSQTHLATQPLASGAATAHPLHPAGLVGVIAGEERARAMRRGSPNPQGGFDMPTGTPPPRAPTQGYPPAGMMMPQMLSPSEHAQLQMSQSVTQMMQMQMQWMQQMTAMMGHPPPGPLPMAGMPPQPTGPVARPQSVPLQNVMPPNQRTMSTLTPSMAGWNQSAPAVPQIHANGSVYAHSIAPSERSNVGLASRYRPVSVIAPEPGSTWAKRASTFTSTSFRPWANENHGPPRLAASTVRAVQADDEDDEQGWAEMHARRENKKKSWKLRKGNKDTSLQELYNAPA